MSQADMEPIITLCHLCYQPLRYRPTDPDRNARVVKNMDGCAGLNPAAFKECVENLKAVIWTLEQPQAHVSHVSLESLRRCIANAQEER